MEDDEFGDCWVEPLLDRVVQEFDGDYISSKLNHEYASNHLEQALNSHWSEYVPVVYRVRVGVDAANEEKRAYKFLLRPLEQLICNGNPDFVFKQLKEYDKPPLLCGRSFKPGEPTYSCRDCSTDPTCVLCVECFQQSLHKNHNYRMSTSGGGGYCDCGDNEAWKSEAFCDIHKKGLQHQQENDSAQVSSVDNLPVDIKDRASAVFQLTVSYAVRMLKWLDNQSLPSELAAQNVADHQGHHVTMLFNDETHTYDQVISTLQKAVSCSAKAAIDFATTVDREGRAIVKDGTYSECETVRKIIERQTSRGQGNKPLKVNVMHSYVVAHQTFALNLLTWLEKITSYSEGLRQLFTVLSLTPSLKPDCYVVDGASSAATSEPISIVESIMLCDTTLWKVARVISHRLFMAGILMDVECKKQFAILFTKIYDLLMNQFVHDDHDYSVCAISESVQLFTVPTLARMLITKHNLIKVILEAFDTHCQQRINDQGKLVFGRQTRSSSFPRAQYMLIDLRYALTNRPMASDEWNPELREGFLAGFDSLLNLLCRVQGMDAVTRQLSQHVEYEPEWEGAFNLQLKLADVLTILLDWCSTDATIARAAYEKTLSCLTDGSNSQKTNREMVSVSIAGHSTVSVGSDFTLHPISVHLPLTRLLAGLYLLVAETPEYFTVDELMEPSLHMLVMVAQSQAGMWRRNGYSLQNQVYFYQSVRFRGEMFDRDVMMMQIGASMMDSNQFVLQLLYKFGLTNWIRSDYDTVVSQDDSVKQIITLAEHFLLLLLTCVCERYTPGIGQVDDASASFRRDIIHLLCLQPMSHSELVKTLPEDPYRETNIEGVVKQVAVFKKPTGLSGKGMYELKEECYSEYSPYYYHYSWTEQAKSEEFVRKHRGRNAVGAALIPPFLPKFTDRFRRVIGLLNCDLMISIMHLVLNRSSAKYSKSWSEAQLEMVLYLIALALHHEREAISAGDESFNFTNMAKTDKQPNICTLLENLSNHANITNLGQKDLISYNIKTMYDLCKMRDVSSVDMVVVTEQLPNIAATSSAATESKLEKESRKKREIAAKRRERIMSQMARMQRNFIRENRELFEKVPSDASFVSMDDSESQSETLTEEEPQCSSSVALGCNRTGQVPPTLRQTCILCQEEQDVSRNNRALVLCAYVSRSTILAKHRDSQSPPPAPVFDPLFMGCDIPRGTYVSACGHVMHADCWSRFLEPLIAKETRRGLRFRRQQASFDITKNEFLCPLCETISNTVLPLMPSLQSLVGKDSINWMLVIGYFSASVVEPELSFSDWLDGIQKTVRHSVQQQLDRESSEESFLFVPCPLSSVTKMMTESVARNFQLLFDYYVCDEDPSAHFSDSVADFLRKFCTDVYSTGLGVLPDDGNVNVPTMVWMSCAYTIMTVEHCLRFEDKPLFGAISSRQSDCVSSLVRLAAVSGHVSTTAVVKQHCVTLLGALVCDGVEGRRLDARRHSVLDFDMFHHLVALCLALPALYAEDETARKQLHVATGGLNDLHALRLVFVAHVVQILIAVSSQAIDASEPMDVEYMIDDADAKHLHSLYTDIMNHIRLGEVPEISPTTLLMYTRQACLPFLRAAALFFHFLTNVPAPAELTTNCSLESQFDCLCTYLGMPTSISMLLSESDILRRLIPCWYSDPLVKQKLIASKDGTGSSLTNPLSLNQLLSLPHDYSELINQVSSFTCPSSDGDESRVPAMCLVCGTVLCSQSYCCQSDIEDGVTVGAATAHAHTCGAGTGIFLRVKECQILLLNGYTKGCFLPAPYLDNYGETDQGLKRGNPLHLCPERYQKLQKLWLSHGVVEEIVHLLESNNGLINVEWNHM